MTDQHPLTYDIIDGIAQSGHLDNYGDYDYAVDNMRAAADWQLEQVIEWLRDTHEEHIGLLAVIKDLREAMRQAEGEAS